MAYGKQKVIDIALAEVGYREKSSNSGLDSPTANSGGGGRGGVSVSGKYSGAGADGAIIIRNSED